jgi:hypothetical protein
MKGAFLVLIIIGILAALTSVRYRKQIAGMIGFARMLKDARTNISAARPTADKQETKGMPLVHCAKCGIWVPENKARKVRDGYACSEH